MALKLRSILLIIDGSGGVLDLLNTPSAEVLPPHIGLYTDHQAHEGNAGDHCGQYHIGIL